MQGILPIGLKSPADSGFIEKGKLTMTESQTNFEKWFRKEYPRENMTKRTSGGYYYKCAATAWKAWQAAAQWADNDYDPD